MQSQVRFRHDPQCAPASREQLHQIVARHVLHYPAARSDLAAVGEHGGQPQHEIPRRSVQGRQGTGRARGDGGAHTAGPQGIEGPPLAGLRQLGVERLEGHARLYGGEEILRLVLDGPDESPSRNHQIKPLRPTVGEPAAVTRWGHRPARARRVLHQLGQLLQRGRRGGHTGRLIIDDERSGIIGQAIGTELGLDDRRDLSTHHRAGRPQRRPFGR